MKTKKVTITIRDNVYPYSKYYLDTALEWKEGFDDSCLFNFSDYDHIKSLLLEERKTVNYDFDIMDFDTGKLLFSSDFRPEFYYSNLVNGWAINKQAVDNLLNSHSIEELIQVDNYDELGLVEYVAAGKYYIEGDHICKVED